MSWYLFKNSPAQQSRGKKVDGYGNLQKQKIILDWGLGQLSPNKQSRIKKDLKNNSHNREDHYRNNQQSNANEMNPKSINNQKIKRGKKAIQQAIKILTESSDTSNEQDNEQLVRVLKEYNNKKKQQKQMKKLKQKNSKRNQYQRKFLMNDYEGAMISGQGNTNTIQRDQDVDSRYYKQGMGMIDSRILDDHNFRNIGTSNKQAVIGRGKNSYSQNILNDFKHNGGGQNNSLYGKKEKHQFLINSNKSNNQKKDSFIINRPKRDSQHSGSYDDEKRMRYLQNSLLPVRNKHDQMTAILDYDLNSKIGTQDRHNNPMTDSRVSGKSHFGNKKNESAVQMGTGYNQFKPIKQKVKEMNDKLKEMYNYDEWCRSRKVNHFQLG